MSSKYPGGIISKTAPTPSGTLETSTAPGIWTLEQQAYWQKLGQWPVPGNVPVYIEDYLYTYLRPAQGGSITYSLPSGVDLYNKGGIVWVKSRSAAQSHAVMNPNFKAAGGKSLQSNSAAAFDVYGTSEFAVNSGNTITMANGNINDGSYTYVDWTFVKQPKFFDVVTYTGNGVAGKIVTHNLGSVPGCIMVKKTSGVENWSVYHRGAGNLYTLELNSTAARDITNDFNYAAGLTSTEFQVGSNTPTNQNGATYIAYLFAHDAGGFGLTGTDNVISCGSWTGTGSTFNVNLGYEPQWLMFKRTDDVGDWIIIDNMRGFTTTGADAYLRPNTSGAESNITGGATPNSTGFSWATGVGSTFIYIAIRRGPMRVPTSGTSVYNGIARTGNGVVTTLTGVGFAPDLFLTKQRQANDNGSLPWYDKLRGVGNGLLSTATSSERTDDVAITAFLNNGVVLGNGTGNGGTWSNASGYPYINYFFGRAPGFFDEVCYTGNGEGANNQTHNLGVVPEMCILRRRSSAANWQVVHKNDGVTAASLALNLTNATISTSVMSANFTSTYFKTADATCWYEASNGNTSTFVAWLFATCPGVSKVGNYTGTGTLTTINCGFTGGARFVLIKRTDSTSNWFVWDTARGMTTGTDPSLTLNTTSAEVNANSVFTIATGFQLLASPSDDVNTNGGTYIFLAIA